jgi:hypothetical protein
MAHLGHVFHQLATLDHSVTGWCALPHAHALIWVAHPQHPLGSKVAVRVRAALRAAYLAWALSVFAGQ